MKFKMYLSGAFVAALLSGFVLGGCSKDEDDPDQGKKAKITISVSDAFSKAEGDHFQFGVGASDSKGASVDWKINGETEKRSEEHTSELQSLMRISYAAFCLKKKNIN